MVRAKEEETILSSPIFVSATVVVLFDGDFCCLLNRLKRECLKYGTFLEDGNSIQQGKNASGGDRGS